ncbi:MAG: hypothetical protein A2750_04405 [Candidatus Yanofskybacteria bacterium RIFCSPHIGHO2_01_FULL_45_42]|uniref:Uncharacterized protein n=2 Tax=Candidatus Yanofskyibacteriota TaxID=1752733 RepID=A0A1F8FR76_9BACT|nr:MAG: hypothetical protein A2750_04405 [Candidatus Yanofskybacteria bacterium RIFCSPHIGHO2_01_FULL_45_42]OGN14936.1 MAG: hypothetical protein A3J47_00810 [Candidatus Yanofskybacteria bacterium RIFCSPHIGHO2_02_FULL_43_22]
MILGIGGPILFCGGFWLYLHACDLWNLANLSSNFDERRVWAKATYEKRGKMYLRISKILTVVGALMYVSAFVW